MLTPEQAKARLATWILPDEENRLRPAAMQLPANARRLAQFMWDLQEGDKARLEWSERRALLRETATRLDELSSQDLAQLFEVISPKLVSALTTGWELLKTAPYQIDYARKAFRAADCPQATALRRLVWLINLGNFFKQIPADVLTPAWVASWAVHLGGNSSGHLSGVGVLLAAVLQQKTSEADEVYEILRQSLLNQHEIGAMGRHISGALMLADRREGWELIEKTLLAAQRQEGLRQVILEAIDESHPDAFRRMLRLILDHDLIRFSATVRAVDVWFGNLWAAGSTSAIKTMLTQVVDFLDNPDARNEALIGKDAQSAFLALWCQATEDALASIPQAEKLLSHKLVEMRYVAAKHLLNLSLDAAAPPLIRAIGDADLRVALLGLPVAQYHAGFLEIAGLTNDDRFERIEKLLERIPSKPQKLTPIVWPWTEIQVKQSDVARHLLVTRGSRPATRLIPHLAKLESNERHFAVMQLTQDKPWDAVTRQAIFELAGDPAVATRNAALGALQEAELEPHEVPQLEAYLSRKTGDLRRSIMTILLKQADRAALGSAARLLATKDVNQRLAGLELLRLMVDAQRSVADCRAQAAEYATQRKKLTKEEQVHLDEIATDKQAVATLADALGLMNPADRTKVVAPRHLNIAFVTTAAVACLKSLDALIHEYRETPIQFKNYAKEQHEELLGNMVWGFRSPNISKPRPGQIEHLPLADAWTTWLAKRSPQLKDSDGLELVRALVWSELCGDSWNDKAWVEWAKSSPERSHVAKLMSGGHEPFKLRYVNIVKTVIEWLLFLYPLDARDFLLDATEASYSLVPPDDLARLANLASRQRRSGWSQQPENASDWRDDVAFTMWSQAIGRMELLSGHKLNTAQRMRRWQLLHWLDEPYPGAARNRPDSNDLLDAYEHNAATLTDIADSLLGPRGWSTYSTEGFDLLSVLSSRGPSKRIESFLSKHPEVKQFADRAVARIIDLELARGDAVTAATAPAYFIKALWGSATLERILRTLGKADFKLNEGWRTSGLDRRQSLTNLAQITYPSATDVPEEFVKRMKSVVKAGEFPEVRLLQLMFLAPQWIKFIGAYLGWAHLDEGVYWFLAHMQMWGSDVKDKAALAGGVDDFASEVIESPAGDEDEADDDADDATKPREIRLLSTWQRLIAERTALSDAEREAGAIDVPWFRSTYALLGPKKWETIASAARFAANASQAKRARFIGDVLLGKVKRKELIDAIRKKQLKECVRLLGLLPLATGAKQAADLQERCLILQEYRRYANRLSGLTKPDALRAWEIGLKNLAQTAGFADPLRLEWAVGAEAVKDLAGGPVSVTKAGVTVTLSLGGHALPEITVSRNGKQLKAIPPTIKKDKKIVELIERVSDIRRQASSIKRSLELAMCRGDVFSGAELRVWCGHALLIPHLSRLVVVGEGISGYPDKDGRALRDCRGQFEPVKAQESLRFAHPYDLLVGGDWHEWQRECFQAERMQPFKQVFRELYVLTKQEKKAAISSRYDGQQLQPKQALALFGSRGWNTGDGIFKVFHDEGLTASVDVNYVAGTPAEVEGWTLNGVSFRKRDQWKPLKLAEVPQRLFSEVMRDLDLVVSVAHAGGVDPEASASTIEMRSGLVRETCALLQLKNVKFKSSHAIIDGKLANYSIHLGSGSVHRMPGGHLCIIAVPAQHRGRLFLPFADDDPKTAEVISKVLLLARDQEIQDPSILEQIRG